MKIERIEIDSAVFGRNVLALKDVSYVDDIAANEKNYIRQFHPVYVSCHVPLENLAVIHRLEEHGFRLIECQIRIGIRLMQSYDVSRYAYEYHKVVTRDALNEVLDIASHAIVHDRFMIDPEMPQGVSGARYRRYVEKSFAAADEEVWRLYDPGSRRTLFFWTHRVVGPEEVIILLGCVHPELKNLGLGVAASYFFLNQRLREGFRRVTTHISAINYSIANIEIIKAGFRVEAVFAVLRKVYP